MKKVSNRYYDHLNVNTGEYDTYTVITEFYDGTPMTDAKCDGVIYRKYKGEYIKFNSPGYVSVKRFGALCDGITNDSASINAALNIVRNQDVVIIPENTVYDQSVDFSKHKVLNLTTPQKINSFTYPNANLHARMQVYGGYLYVCEYTNSKISVFDLSNEKEPILIQEFVVGATPRHLEIIDGRLVVCCTNGNLLEVYNIDSPVAAGLVISIPCGAGPKMFTVVGNYLYLVCNGTSTIEKYDITRIDFPILIGSLAVSNSPLAIAYGNELFFVVGLSDKLDIFSLAFTNNFPTTLLGATHGTVEALGNCILITDTDRNKLVIYSVNSVAAALPVSEVDVSPDPEQITVIGETVFVPSLTNPGVQSYLDMINISDLTNPTLIKSIPLTVTGGGFTAFTDNCLYVNGHFEPYNIDVVDISTVSKASKRFRRKKPEKTAKQSLSTVQMVRSITVTADHTLKPSETLVRAGLSPNITLFDPEKVAEETISQFYYILNVGIGTVTVTNPYDGYVTGTIASGGSLVLAASKFGIGRWDIIK